MNLEIEIQERVINEIKDQELGIILNEMFMDDMVNMLEELPAGVVKRVLKNTDEKTRGTINTFLKYGRDSAGSVMTTEYTHLRANMTVKEAIEYLRVNGGGSETIYTCFVIEEDRVLDGMVSLRNLLLSKDEEKVSEIMDSEVVKVHTGDDKEMVAQLFTKYDYLTLPVVDSGQVFQG